MSVNNRELFTDFSSRTSETTGSYQGVENSIAFYRQIGALLSQGHILDEDSIGSMLSQFRMDEETAVYSLMVNRRGNELIQRELGVKVSIELLRASFIYTAEELTAEERKTLAETPVDDDIAPFLEQAKSRWARSTATRRVHKIPA